MKLNPEYSAYKASTGAASSLTPVEQSSTIILIIDALVVVSNMNDYEEYNNVNGADRPMAESTSNTLEILQDEDIALSLGMPADDIVDAIGALFAKYEVPIGMMNKLMELQTFDGIHFLIDDSGSMGAGSDYKGAGHPVTRWQECQIRLNEILEILVYVPTPPILITFLNRATVISIERKEGESPPGFLRRVTSQLHNEFTKGPSGTTPFLRKASESIGNGKGKQIVRYFFGDGYSFLNYRYSGWRR
jgi:hypothetical protein